MTFAQTILDDSRLGQPSASSLGRYFACRGAWQLEQHVSAQLSPAPQLKNAAADRGTLIHKANEESDVSGLEIDAADSVEQIRNIEVSLCQAWAAEHEFELEAVTVIREERFWFHSLFSVKVDTLVFSPCFKHALIIDAKSGRKAVAPPVRNWQLRAAAVAVGEDIKALELVRAAIAQPFAKEQPVCDYTRGDLIAATAILSDLISDIQKPNRPRVAGTHCEHCPAKHICPEARASMSVVIRQAALNWDLVKPEDKVRLWKSATLAEQAVKLIKAQIRKDIETDPESVPGLVKKPDQKPRKITDLNAAWQALAGEPGESVTLKEFVAACGLSMKDFTALYREKTGANKAEAEKFIADKCAAFITEGFKAGPIELKEAA